MKFLLSLLIVATSLSVQAITIGTYNIRNFDYDQRSQVQTNKPALATIIKDLNVDVLSVEEINNTAEFERFVAKQMPGYLTELTRCGGAHGQRLGFLYNSKKVELLGFNEDLSLSNPGGQGTCDSGSRPMAIALFQIKATKQKFYGMTVHLKSGPNGAGKREKQYQIIKRTIQDLKSRTGVKDFYVAGDFNTTEFSSRGSDYKKLNAVVSELGMVNLAARVACTSYWWGGSDDGIETPSVLDHVIVSPGLLKITPETKVSGHCQKVRCQEVSERELGISYEGVSDHCPVTATIQ